MKKHTLVQSLSLIGIIILQACNAEPIQAWWVDAREMDVDVLTVRSFQGIVNRSGPRLFVVEWEDDMRWVKIFAERYADQILLTKITSQEELFNHPEFRKLCSTMVVYDKADSELAMNGALTLAGIHGACAVDVPDIGIMKEYGFRIVDDKRDFPEWQTNEDVNKWAVTVQDKTNQRFYCVSEGLLHGSPKSVDTAVSLGMLWFLLDAKGVHQNDQDVQEQILAKYPPHTIATGWWSGEVHDVRMVSAHGHTFATNSVNCSFFLHGDDFIEIGKQKVPADPLPEVEPDKVYAFISYTQGDAIYFCSDRNMNQWTAMSEDGSGKLVREKYPFGLMHNSIQTILQPMVPAYFYDTQDPPNQWFSGKAYGYAYPSTLLENGYLAEHLDKGGEAMIKMDVQDLMLNDRAAFLGTSDTALIEHILHIIDPKPRSLIIKHPLGEAADEKDSPMIFNGIPAFGDPVMERTFKDKSMDIPATADAIYESMQNRQFFWIFLKNQAKAWEVEKLYQHIEADSRFENLVLMNPDTFIRLYKTQYDPGFSWRITEDTWVEGSGFRVSHGDDRELKIGQDSVAVMKFIVDTWDEQVSKLHLRVNATGSPGTKVSLLAISCTEWDEDSHGNLLAELNSGELIEDKSILDGEEFILFDVSKVIDQPGEYAFAISSNESAESVTISSRESKTPPWLIAE